jgi:thiamine phosphate synthase YjbQ (UPF0047 family)
MATRATEVTLQLRPKSRVDLINVSRRIVEEFGDRIARHRKALYFSYHTTAGYLEERLCRRLEHDTQNVQAFLRSFQQIFPPNANYRHDQLELREELSEAQRVREPRNADAHLTFIGSGLTNCVTYSNQPAVPVYFIDLDGIHGNTARNRRTTVVGFDSERLVDEIRLSVPVSGHPIDSVNLKSPQLGLFEEIQDRARRLGVERGRVLISLDRSEQHAALTVNEFETLLMKHDLVEVLRNPLRFMAERGRHMLADPRAIPVKAKGYAKYDLVQLINEFLDVMGLNESMLEKLIHRFMAYPAARFLRMKRSLNLLVTDPDDTGGGTIAEGTYQSPILVQWAKSPDQTRRLRAAIYRFD